MATWDIFHSDRLEVEREISTEAVRAGLSGGAISEDDLVRPSGVNAPWTRIGDRPKLFAEPAPASVPPPAPPPEPEPIAERGGDDSIEVDIEFEPDEEEPEIVPEPPGALVVAEHEVIRDVPSTPSKKSEGAYSEFDLSVRKLSSDTDRPVSSAEVIRCDDDLDEEADPLEEDEAAAEFTLARGRSETVEELDLAAMVDVAFQLVLFFLVTATTVLYKSLEVPKPNPDSRPPEAATQGNAKSLDDLRGQYIVVQIDPAGAVKIDNEPVKAELSAMVERLRALRRPDRNSMLLSADFATPHKSAVLAYDAANEIGLQIAIAKPASMGVEP